MKLPLETCHPPNCSQAHYHSTLVSAHSCLHPRAYSGLLALSRKEVADGIGTHLTGQPQATPNRPPTHDWLGFRTFLSILSFRIPPIRGSVTNCVVYFGDPSHRSVGLKWARRAGGSETVAKSWRHATPRRHRGPSPPSDNTCCVVIPSPPPFGSSNTLHLKSVLRDDRSPKTRHR